MGKKPLRWASIGKKLGIVAMTSVFVLSLLEGLAIYGFRHFESASGPLLYFLRAVYLTDRDFIQYNQLCSRYDDSLGYTLRPGTCTFSNVEYSVTVKINRLGLRDDEESLTKPDVIVLGDSHAMGWGVEQDDTFAEVLQKKTALKVLNAAISSYGTAREIGLLRRLDSSNLKLLIIQYCDNDYEENAAFVENGGRLPTMSYAAYSETTARDDGARRYVFGQYLARFFDAQLVRRLQRVVKGSRQVPDPTGPSPKAHNRDFEAELFMRVLESGGLKNDWVVIVLEIDAFRIRNGDFINALRERAPFEEKKGKLPHMEFIDLRELLSSKHFFKLDDHLNRYGHQIIADQILKKMNSQLR